MGRRPRFVLAGVGIGVLAVTALIAVLAVTAPTVETATAGTGSTTPVVSGEDLDAIHDSGITGDGVRVGVVDVTGFDPGHESIESQVVATRSFGRDQSVRNAGRHDHGTAAASLVARVAPDAELALATFDTPRGYHRAVRWLLDRDVDVIVAPVSFYGTPGDGSARVARVAERARAENVTFVAPTGNLARGHWDGEYDDPSDGKLRFSGGTRNYLRSDGATELTLWLSWDRAHAAETYRASLYWTDGNRTQLIARSQPYERDGVPNQRLSVQLEGGDYFVVVRGPSDATGAHLELVSPTHRFQYDDPAGSITAPATADDVLAVGAYDLRRDRPEPFSSRGPTTDGRTGVDVVAPDRLPAAQRPDGFVGSSAGAPYVGGLAALLLDVDPSRSPTAVERALERHARDVGRDGVDMQTGHGLVRPAPTVRAVANDTG
ncbi:S8 family serine peptidase [Halomicrobium sp. LC1Hm]|uniref:S8 family serine peptidase n=1 Tax=Halomicrobium sp. LC1Hm TaxID=2610902 RepID=UPI0012982AD2|nr:S8 family serine peptidase [Halomicrobium sp. LC1Hm]QGA83634.1 Subtilisin-like serine protease [Halomicrobium sp. LC1Hm]